MANNLNLSKAHPAAKPPPVKGTFYNNTCTNHLLHEPYSNKNYEIHIKQLVQPVLDAD
jgi:hypothetical protein